MTKPTATELTHNPLPVCPNCGAEEHDAWEINFGPGLEGDAEIHCGSCDEEYKAFRFASVTYSTEALPTTSATPQSIP